jgi:hypothetical protein
MSVFSAIRAFVAKYPGLTKLAVAALAVVIIATVVIDYGLGTSTSESNVVADWNETIKTLGIEPVFPPEEDLYVGDVLAVIVDDENPTQTKTNNRALLNRAIKLTHLNLHDELVTTYTDLPLFPKSLDKTKEIEQVGTPSMELSVFDAPNKRVVLPLAAFPGFSIHHRSDAGLAGFLKAQFAARIYQDDDVELTIPFVETYGIPSMAATKILTKFCVENGSICKDAILRRQLSFVSPAVFDYDTTAFRATGELHYYANIDLELVNRVYLATSIQEHRGKASGRSASASAFGPGFAPAAATATKVSTEAGATPSGSGADAAKTAPAPIEGANSVSAQSVSEDKSELKQDFDRPVVIGYRAVKIPISQDFDQQALTSGQK